MSNKSIECLDRDSADSLRERVYRHLEELFYAGRIRNGELLDQDGLCKQLGVSRTPLRDALIRLEAEGFITIVPRKGVFITPLSDAFVKSACQIIGALESEALQASFHKITARMIRQLEASVRSQEELLLSEQFREYRAEDEHFHDMLFQIADNQLMLTLVSRLRCQLSMMSDHPLSPVQARAVLADHRRVVESLKMGNYTAAASILRFERWSPLRFLSSKPVKGRRKAATKTRAKEISEQSTAA